MADFKMHLGVASVTSGLAAISLLEIGLATPRDVLLYFFMGSVGGILPDVDADSSLPARMLFTIFALVFAFLAIFLKMEQYSIVELAIVWVVIYCLIRQGIAKLFATYTIHRGVFHTLLAAAFFGLLITVGFFYGLRQGHVVSWMAGCFVSLGYCIHLLLDEIYSVDLLGRRLKKSFGTAFKPISYKYFRASVLLFFATVLVYACTPSAQPFLKTVSTMTAYQQFHKRLLPQGRWFGW